MCSIAGIRINHPYGAQVHHFGPSHERLFPYYLWRPILRMVHSGSRFLRCLKVHNLVWSLRVPGVYLTWANQVFLVFLVFLVLLAFFRVSWSFGWVGGRKKADRTEEGRPAQIILSCSTWSFSPSTARAGPIAWSARFCSSSPRPSFLSSWSIRHEP